MRRGCTSINRTYHEIIAEILQAVRLWAIGRNRPSNLQSTRECRFHHISYSIGLPWISTREYLDLLIGQKLLNSSPDAEGIHYLITAKGESYLRIFAEMEELMQPIPTEEELLISVE